jgi:hypothetical protein
MHPLRKLREGPPSTLAQIKALLAENAVFHSPILVKPVEGRDKVAAMIAACRFGRHGFYAAEYRLDDRNTFLRWKGTIHGRDVESLEVLTDNDEGLLLERTIAYRPFPGLQILREEMYADLKDILAPDYWDYAAEGREDEKSDS